MEDHKKITEANRAAWNQATKVHQKNRKINLAEKFADPGFLYLDELERGKLEEIGLEGRVVAQLGCNNGRETISLVRLGANVGVGFDISDEVIEEAKTLAEIARANCQFIRTDVYEIESEWDGRFDFVYITIGALIWMPDLDKYFAVVARLLKPGGQLAIYEQHPFMYCFATPDDPEYDEQNKLMPTFSYFRKEPWVEEGGIDYIGKTRYDSSPSYSYTQTMSDIVNAIVSHGMRLRELQEYPHDISTLWDHIGEDTKLPKCYWLRAEKDR